MRLKKFQNFLKKEKIDFAFFYNFDGNWFDPNIHYFSEYTGLGCLIVPKDKKPFLIVPKMEETRARLTGSEVHVWDKIRLFDVMKRLFKNKKIKTNRIAIDKDDTSVFVYEKMKKRFKGKYIGIDRDFEKIRQTKTDNEISKIKRACKITDNILSECLANFKHFKTEVDVAAFLDYSTKDYGCTTAFKPIVASGKNASQPHYDTYDKKLRKGFCVIDFGVRYKGYCSDMTRTFYIGKPKMNDLKLYFKVLNAQKKSFSMLKPGADVSKIDEAARKVLGIHSKYFIHSLGHGLGLKIHEPPSITVKSKDKLANNMVFTLEPGVYIPDKLGIRIEDTILLQKNKPKYLTKTGKNLLVLRK